ncbi:hypothetical protein GGX14DRAFT_424384 [Mycena pura]|uniref:Nitrogen regulatory protein areA GATA-like domain-containing protein n=1 Tax=Mycena pura TaxID=153505 RepID=A0AAD6YMX6_9AGAR|nr:hypothetical protein GGX14DRAFT_424384 [Mycena pura]
MAQYLPVLLASVSANAIPDDSALVTLPRGQVDYLSHEWAEEDVWLSWRSMTRQKNEIANGVRLENASWRTWWKQRNKLKTISPETLNWLKDSDVTWLYGPLHTAVDWTPPPKPKSISTEVGKPFLTEDSLDLAVKQKSILKHRSISELLQSDLPASPLFSPAGSDDENDAGPTESVRPPLIHTKSAPLVRPLLHSSLRKPSPPRVLQPLPASAVPPSATVKRHITFNTFVEQCIAVDSPRRYPLSQTSSTFSNDLNFRNNADFSPVNRTLPWDGRTSGRRWKGGDDESDDDGDARDLMGESALSSDSDEPLEMCLPRSRSGSRSSRSSSNNPGFSLSIPSQTIVPIAPTRLKTTGVGNSWVGGEWVSTLDKQADDTCTPRTGTTVHLNASVTSRNLVPTFEDDSDEEEVFTHQSSYFSADAYDYFRGPDLGDEFGSGVVTREQRGRRGNSGAGIIEIEGASPLRSSARSRSRSKSRSRTPSPAVIPQLPSAPNAGVLLNAGATPHTTRSGLLSPPPRGRDSSASSSSSASVSQSRGRSVTRTSSSGSLSDRERSRSSHTSPLGSLSPDYGGVRPSANGDAGVGTGFAYGYGGGMKGMHRKAGSSLSPHGESSVSPENTSVASTSTSSSMGTGVEDLNSNSGSGSSEATATRPNVVDTVACEDENERQSCNPTTPANSPVVFVRVPEYVAAAERAGSSSTFAMSSVNSTPTKATAVATSASTASPSGRSSSSNKPASSASKSIPSTRPGSGAPTIELGVAVNGLTEYDEDAVEGNDDEAIRRMTPTPANSPVVRTRPPPRILASASAGAVAPVNGWAPKPESTAKSISPSGRAVAPRQKLPNPPPSPTSCARATFQTGASVATAERTAPVLSRPGIGSPSPSENALQRTLVPPQSNGDIVGKAVGIVTTAGAYFGLWSGA